MRRAISDSLVNLASGNCKRKWSSLRRFRGHFLLRKLLMTLRVCTGSRNFSSNSWATVTWASVINPLCSSTCSTTALTGNCWRPSVQRFVALDNISLSSALCTKIRSLWTRRFSWDSVHHRQSRARIRACWPGIKLSNAISLRRIMLCKRSRSTLGNSGNVVSMTGVSSPSAKMENCSQWKLSANLSQFSHTSMTKMTTTSKMLRRKLVVLHRVGSLFIPEAHETTHSTRFRSITRTPK